MKVYKKLMNALAAVEKIVLVISTLLILVLTVGNVFSRKVIHRSWSFTEELVVAVFVLITLLAAALACREKGGLVSLTLVTDRLPKKLEKPSVILITVLSIVFSAILFKYGMDKVLTQLANGKRTFVLNWPETTWNFACSTTETSTWADGGRKFGELMEKATGGKVKVNIYAADQLTNGNQSEGIQALMNGDPVQISMHSNLIYSAFDPRFNVVSLPFIYDSYDDADAKFDGEAGDKLKEILNGYGLHCMGIAENGFRELTNSKHEVKSVDDMKNLKVRVAGSNLLMECYKRWGADATNMNWSETYTALQQNTVEGEENPLPAIDAASVQEVQPYCSMWDAIYDCLFFCINQDIYDALTPEQQAVVDECGQKAVEYERYINRSSDDEIKARWADKNGVTFTEKKDMDIDSFKKAVDGVDDWFVQELKKQGYNDGQDLVDLFTK